jgi:hypothetical protein
MFGDKSPTVWRGKSKRHRMGRVYARFAAPRPADLSQRDREVLVKQLKKESQVVAVRLTSAERADVTALAAVEGKSVSAYIRDRLQGARNRPRPTLAAAGALLAICDALWAAAAKADIDEPTRDLIAEQARLVIGIIQLHEREYRP